MRLIFAHGLESGPQGRKTQWLREAGHEVVAPDCRRFALAGRIALLLGVLEAESAPPLLVGSSFGGIAGLVAAIHAAARGRAPRALLLIAPALQVPVPPPWRVPLAPPCPAAVVHGERDEIVPFALGRDWAAQHGARLWPCDDDHALVASRAPILAALDALASQAAAPVR